MAALGSVVVELSANIVKFQSDLGKAAAVAESRMKEIDKSFAIVKTSLAVLGAGFLANATFDKIKGKIEDAVASAAGLKELSERTGTSAAALSGLASVAKLSGTDTESLAAGLQKLSKSMVDAASGGTKTEAAFNAIGISAKDIDKQKPDEVFLNIAKQLDKYADGANKTAVAQQLFGKSGANLLPVMKDLADVGEIQVKTTNEQAAAADEYDKGLKRLQMSTNAIYKVIALEAVPAMNSFVQALLSAQKESGGLSDQAKKLAKDGTLKEFFEEAAIYAAKFIDTLASVKNEIAVVVKGVELAAAVVPTFKLRFGKKDDLDKEDVASGLRDQIDKVAKLRLEFSSAQDKFLGSGTTYEDRLRAQFTKDKANPPKVEEARPDANFTAGLAKENKAGDNPAKKILEGKLKVQENFIASEKEQLQNREQYLDYFQNLEYITAREALETKQRLIADNLAQTQAGYDKEISDLTIYIARAAKETDKQDGRNKRQEAITKRANAEIEANQRIGKSVLDIDAIQRRFNLATDEHDRQLTKANAEAQFQIDILGKSTIEVQQLVAARQNELDLEERIFQLRKQDPAADVSDAIAKSQAQQANAAKLIADRYEKEKSGAFGASEAMRKYGEDSVNIGAQIESSLTNAFKSAEDAFVQFSMTGKLSFSSLAQSILADLARIQAKKAIAGLIDMATSFFGSSSTGLDDTSGSLFSSSGSDIRGRHANGGALGTYGNYLVGENGPEVLRMGGMSGTIIPNNQLGGGGSTVNVIVNAQTGQTSATGDGGEMRRFGTMIGDKVREIILTEKRNGGLLA